jgi:hypothetical protein
MAFSINTNIASLQSQAYLRISGNFQQKTINRVSRGLRIIAPATPPPGECRNAARRTAARERRRGAMIV